MMINQEEREKIIMDELEADVNVPWMYRWTKISHYYGDSVRQLLIAAATIMLVTAPFYTDNLPAELPFIVFGSVVLVCVAALTNPWKSAIISADTIAAGVGLVIFEMWALLGYADAPLYKFVLREALAVIFLFALYFSTKTLRAMLLHTIGKPDRPGEFRRDAKPMTPSEETHLTFKQEAREALYELNKKEKFETND